MRRTVASVCRLSRTRARRNATQRGWRTGWGRRNQPASPAAAPAPHDRLVFLHRLAGGGRGVLEGYKSLKEDLANQRKAGDAFLVVLGKEMQGALRDDSAGLPTRPSPPQRGCALPAALGLAGGARQLLL